jgi:hypothetical protein
MSSFSFYCVVCGWEFGGICPVGVGCFSLFGYIGAAVANVVAFCLIVAAFVASVAFFMAIATCLCRISSSHSICSGVVSV